MSAMRRAILNAVAEADRLHEQFGSKASIDAGVGRIDVFGMFASMGIPLVFRPLDGLLGAYVNEDSVSGALVTTKRPLSVQRFTAAHELGHAVMHHEESLDDEAVLMRMPYEDGQGKDRQELEANVFASELLMPQWLIVHHMRQQEWRAADLQSPLTVYQLSLRLGTSYSAMCHNLVYKKIISRNVYTDLLTVKPRDIKRSLAAPYEPPNWFGDVWELSERDSGMVIEGSKSDLVVLRLPEHSGSGFLWRMEDLDPAGMVVVYDESVSDDPEARIGGLVTRRAIASADGVALGTVHLRELRPWMAECDPLNTITLRFDLTGPVGHGLHPAQREASLQVA